MNLKQYFDKYKKNKLAKSSISFLTIKMLSMAFGYVNIIIITKFFGKDALGIFSYIVSILALTGTFAGLGTEMATVRFVSKFRIKKKFGKIKSYYFQVLKIVSIPGIFLSALFFFFPNFIADYIFGKPENAIYLQYFSILIIPISFRKINNQFLRGYKKIGQFAFIKFFFTPITVIILIFIIFFSNNRNPGTPISVHFFSLFLMFLISFIMVLLLKNWKKAKITDKINLKDIFKVSIPMLFVGVAAAVVKQADKIILGYFVSNTEIGIYHAMNRTALLINIVLLTANSGLAPRFSELMELKKLNEVKKLAFKSTKYITFFSFLIFALILIFSKPILSFLEIEFFKGFYILLIIAIAQMFSAWVGPVASFLLMSGNEKINRNVSIISAFIFIAFNIIFVYFFGIIGSAISTALLVLIKNITFVIIVKRKYNILFLYLPKFKTKGVKYYDK